IPGRDRAHARRGASRRRRHRHERATLLRRERERRHRARDRSRIARANAEPRGASRETLETARARSPRPRPRRADPQSTRAARRVPRQAVLAGPRARCADRRRDRRNAPRRGASRARCAARPATGGRGVKLKRLAITHLPGIPGGLTLENFGDELNVVTGPNASGKSSLIRALRHLIDPAREPGGAVTLEAELVSGERSWTVTRSGREIVWRSNGRPVDPPPLPASDFLQCYWLSMDDLLAE